MVKSYLRYEHALSFGVITSSNSNICYDASGSFLISPVLDSIAAWNPRTGVCSKTLRAASQPSRFLAVCSLASSPTSDTTLASGHADGSVRLWDISSETCLVSLNGHNSGAGALRFSPSGSFLASGGDDCDVILWDVVAESGLFRLRGHRDKVTDLAFLDKGKKLVSSSSDKFMRVWDLDMQQCVQIIIGHHSKIWSIDVDYQEKYLVAGSGDEELQVYKVNPEAEEGSEVSSKWEILRPFGVIQRKSKGRVAAVRFNNSGRLLACQVSGKTVELFEVRDEAVAKKKAKKRARKKEKLAKKQVSESNGQEDVETQYDPLEVSDVYKPLYVLFASKEISSMAFSSSHPKYGLSILSLSLKNNVLETYQLDKHEYNKTHTIELQGHRSVILSLALSSDNTLLMSTSDNAIKIWNPSTGSCLRTIESKSGRCSTFVPTNRHALIGTNNGTIEVIDIGSGARTEVKAHAEKLNSIVNTSDGNVFVTAGADHFVKFWEYQIDQELKQLTVVNVRNMEMDNEVVALAISPDSKYISVSLLDCTIKVYFLDSLKFRLSLYGHTLPVFCMDFSSDGDLLVSGSGDTKLKIWGLDFGDCHKSMIAHEGSVIAVKFVGNTHYMFSVGKDYLVKYWDADKFQLLLTLSGHHKYIFCLAVSTRGDFVVTGSHDFSIRRWDRTEEPFFIEEEREKRLEEILESDLEHLNGNRYASKEEVPEEGAVGVPGKQTKTTLSATDMIIDALDMADMEIKRIDEHKDELKCGKSSQFQPNIMLRGFSPSDYVLHSVSNVNLNDLEQVLLSLPFSDALKLMSYMNEWTANHDKIELVCRVCTVLLQSNYNQLTSTRTAKPILVALKDFLQERIKECKDTIGFNLAAMDHLKEMLMLKSDAPFRDAKAKLMEIRLQRSKRNELKDSKKRKKKQKQKEKL